MQFVVSKQNLQKELGFVQGVVEKKTPFQCFQTY